MIIQKKGQLKEIVDQARGCNKTLLIKKGVFDIIHPGHIYAIRKFEEKADIVVILIQSDESTAKKKGKKRPINDQFHRAEVVDGIEGVDYVYLDNSSSREEYIELLNYLQPTVLAVTEGDSEKTRQYSSEYWELIEFPDKQKEGYSTTEIINRVLAKKSR